MWVRVSATIRDKPMLASQADRVSKIRLLVIRNLVFALRDHMAILRNKEMSSSSKHSSIDRKWSRLIIMPIRPR